MIKVKKVRKIARMIEYPRPNLPTAAVIVVCCLIDSLARDSKGGGFKGFVKYLEEKMKKTFQQLQDNDRLKSEQISSIRCNSKGHPKRKCKTSAGILYTHVRCGLVHNYF